MSAGGALAQDVERVVLGRAGVDHERQPAARGEIDVRLERAPLVVVRGVVAEVVEAGLADRAGARVARRRARSARCRASSKPSLSCGWRPTIATTQSCSSAAASARSIDSSFIPTVAIRSTPAARAFATSSASGRVAGVEVAVGVDH